MTTLLLSGWSQPADALLPLAEDGVTFDYSAYAGPHQAIEQMRALAPARVIGWSLGGQLALRAIAAGALAPKHLTLIAAPYQFVSDDPALKGMDSRTFELFRSSYASDARRTSQRFHALLAKGDSDMKRVLPQLAAHPDVYNTARFLPWLDDLGAFSLAQTSLASVPRTLIIHGMNDAIVPHAQGQKLKAVLPHAQLNSWEGVSHVPHVHDPQRLRAEIAHHQQGAA